MHEFLVSAAAFIVLVGVMVVVHEFGHFAVAKLCGVRVEEFSVGFGPRLFGVKYGGTDYKVCLLPIGGFVKMTGENPEQNLNSADDTPVVDIANDPGALTSHPRWQRMLIGVAGPVANFILAFVLMLFYFGVFNEEPSVQLKTTTIEWVVPDSPAAQAGLQSGDVIRHFDTLQNPTWEGVYERVNINLRQTVPITVERGGKTISLFLHVPAELKDADIAGMLPQYLNGPIGVEEVIPGAPAEQAGLRAGDAIQSVDDHPFHTVAGLLAYLQSGAGRPVTLHVVRNGAQVTLVAHPAKLQADTWMLGFAHVPIPLHNEPLPLGRAALKSKEFCADNAFLIVEVLRRLFTHQVSVSQLQGPVGIARMAGEAAEMKGWLPKFGLAAEISLNLGIINLMPFPILDGGMIVLLLIESVIRRDINVDIKERIYQAAFVVLLVFFAFIIFNDMTKLPIFAHLKP